MGWAGVPVRDVHLGQGRPVEDSAPPSLVEVLDQVQHQPLTRGEAHAEAPFLPGYLVAIHLKAYSLRLVDLNGLEIRARPVRKIGDVLRVGDTVGGVVSSVLRERYHPVIIDSYRHAVQFNGHDQTLNGSGIIVVLRAPTHGRL